MWEAWHAGRLPGELRLTDGSQCHIIYRGAWTNSDGPDFESAMVDFGAGLLRGSVEMHVRASDWNRHGHALDPSYNQVVLHVVYVDDLGERVRRQDGSRVPTLELSRYIKLNVTDTNSALIANIGPDSGRSCLRDLNPEREQAIRAVLRAKGWERLIEKQLRFSQAFETASPGDVFFAHLAEAFGYSRNREQMRFVAEWISLPFAERLVVEKGGTALLAALLGTAGFLPLASGLRETIEVGPSLAVQVERFWARLRDEIPDPGGTIPAWNLNRVRPANHPARRLAALADLIDRSRETGLLASFLSLPLDGGRSWDEWLSAVSPAIGEARRQQVIINIFAPYSAAYAEGIGDPGLLDDVYANWERIRGRITDRIARGTLRQIGGHKRLPVRLALEEQGLHQIHRYGCSQARCFECPIAHLAIRFES